MNKFSDSKIHIRFLRNTISSTICTDSPRINKVINVINSLNLHKSVGHDNISSYFLRVASGILHLQYVYLLTTPFVLEYFPIAVKKQEQFHSLHHEKLIHRKKNWLSLGQKLTIFKPNFE